MSDLDFSLSAQSRTETGSVAVRRMRRNGQIPGVVYGAGRETVSITLDGRELMRHLEQEAFYSHILSLSVDGKKQKVILRGIQRHPVRSDIVLHLDMQRIRQDEKIHITVPFHFMGEEEAPGIKEQSGIFSHLMTEIEVNCLPADLPEYIEVDVSHLHIGEPVHLSSVELPDGVELTELMHGHDHAIVIINERREQIIEEEEVEEPEGEEVEGEADADTEDSEQQPES